MAIAILLKTESGDEYLFAKSDCFAPEDLKNLLSKNEEFADYVYNFQIKSTNLDFDPEPFSEVAQEVCRMMGGCGFKGGE